MNNNIYINSFVRIKQNKLNNNGAVQQIECAENESLSKTIYKKLGTSYPKFYKMDSMCKFGFLAAELALNNQNADKNCSLIFANKSASLDTDFEYSKTIQKENFVPSPSVFVYTLANIVMGEISIKHKFVGENIFLVAEKFDAEMLIKAIKTQTTLDKANSFLIEWIEVFEDSVDVLACYLSQKPTENSVILNPENLLNLYNK
ncbi:MAG: 3-oxoacyl-ACP synthase [Bacteroidetes bacterium]|nr:3-oxoacyl-ACP synthase [Bacteroidota bacterium]MCB9225784.1 3-oxoacyl-ACP synthase [Chitinophagales bacterium]